MNAVLTYAARVAINWAITHGAKKLLGRRWPNLAKDAAPFIAMATSFLVSALGAHYGVPVSTGIVDDTAVGASSIGAQELGGRINKALQAALAKAKKAR